MVAMTTATVDQLNCEIIIADERIKLKLHRTYLLRRSEALVRYVVEEKSGAISGRE